MHIVFVNGQRLHLTYRELEGVHRHPHTVMLLLAGLVAFQLIVPYTELHDLPIPVAGIFWAGAVAGFYMPYFGLARLCDLMGRRFVTVPVHAVAAAVMTAIGLGVLAWHTGVRHDPGPILQLWLFLLVVLLLAELVFLTFVFPRVLASVRAMPDGPAGGQADASAGEPSDPGPAAALPLRGVSDRPIRCLYVNARWLDLSWRDILSLLQHRATVGMILAAVVVFSQSHPYPSVRALPAHLSTLFWAGVLVLLFVVYLGAAWLCARFRLPFVSPLALGLVAAAVTLGGHLFLRDLGGDPADAGKLALLWGYHWAVLLLGEFLHVTFLLPLLLHRTAPPPAPADPAGGHTLRCLFTNGRSETIEWRRLIAVFHHPATVGMILAAIVAVTFVHPLPTLNTLPPWLAVLFWVHVVGSFYVLYLGLAWLCLRSGRRLVSPLVLAVIAASLTVSSQLILQPLGGSPATAEKLALLWAYHWAILLAAEFLHASLVLPLILRGLASSGRPGPAAAPPAGGAVPAPAARLVVGGESFDADDLISVSADEHFLRIVTASRTRFLRGRIADVEAQLPPEIGLRVHRSHWVAATAVAGLERAEGGLRLVLGGGARVPVARGRQQQVRDWVRERRGEPGPAVTRD